MKIFKKINANSEEPCPICKTKKNKPVFLIPIQEKQKGFDVEAIQIHVDCLNLWYSEETNMIYQIIGNKKNKLRILNKKYKTSKNV